ncbi:[FeFe] hydrogenase H-cluster radical SAM maturase HydG [Alkaliphilus peptidifermentans]|uniref:Iron-only hydrogenase maturation protein HydG n=1 Tax=Alkaliphilus peptidifermentans DSM 18978 TaxID=1120976 RepID=A0A1G5LDB0_9FIRM|nr:[FeFe] hydrogenase H-cluster radical SAM maturase HydG [Alkaliphilus peptidifermentans]SCZ10907.1 iron-only hydrogenase maturation protein HydG [Alkaliphilus peptidifermentans DSM 18978]
MDTNKIIDEVKIEEIIEAGKKVEARYIQDIIQKGKEAKGISLEEASALLQIEDASLLSELFQAASEVKNNIYGKRIVVFAPLYTSNECTNNCLYCGFKVSNKNLNRRTLNVDETIYEAQEIVNQGHKRILLVCGEDTRKTNIKHITESLKAIYDTTDIRRINVNAAPMSVEDFRLLKEAGIGTYQIFQETYHRETYKKMHPSGLKKNYDYRLLAINRAFEAGIDDIGIGTLLGLYDYRFDVLATLMHAQYLEAEFNVGPHTISVPRLRPVVNTVLEETPYNITDVEFKKIIAVYRLTLPYTGIILSTREPAELRDELFNLGVSQVSAGSKTNPGGYHFNDEEAEQFETSDGRSLNEVLQVICKQGHLPSFCTACYRANRTGEAFMELAKGAEIHEFCQSNAILTFKEHLLDYGNNELCKVGNELLENALEEILNDKIKKETIDKLKETEKGKRDLFF